MKTTLITGCLMTIFLLACGGNPSTTLEKAENRVTNIENKVQKSDEKKYKEAAGMIYATELSLDKAPESKPVQLARGFNDRAQTLVGVPEPPEAAQLRQLVSDLLSQLDQERERGAATLEALDTKLAELTAEKEKLQKELTLAEKKLSIVSRENAVLADKEKQREVNWWNPFDDLKHFFKKSLVWIIIFACLLLAIPILAAFFPVLMPLLSGIGSMLGSAFGWFVKLIPGAVSGAGLIGKKIFDLVDDTKTKLVAAIEQWQQEQKLTGKTDYKDLAQHLAGVLDSDNKEEIAVTKQKIASLS